MVRVGIIENNFTLRSNYSEFLGEFHDMRVVFACKSIREFECQVHSEKSPDVVILDVILADESGIEGICVVKQKFPNSKVVILTSFKNQEYILESIRRGASAYVLKSNRLIDIYYSIMDTVQLGASLSPEVAHVIISQLQRNPEDAYEELLTKREREVISFLREGLSYKVN